MCLIDAGLLIAYAILITHALAGLADMLPLRESHPVEGI
jgi:zinc transporter ZupT